MQVVLQKFQLSSMRRAVFFVSSMALALSPLVHAAETTINHEKFLYADKVDTVGGAFAIVTNKKNEFAKDFVLNKKTVASVEAYNATIEYKFKIDDKDVVLIGVSGGGNACPANYMFATISSAGKFSKTEEFGNCSDIPTVKYDDKSISVSLPSGGGRKIKMETWTYENGKVDKQKR
jgi:hypothetical protein